MEGIVINKNLTINYNLKDDIFLNIEKSTFNILVENILTNAVKFSNSWWNIEIWLDEESFWVKDTWIWINSLEKEQMWNKFFKSDDKKEGFWVWLFIVKRIIKLYNWEIKVESKKWYWTKIIINF